MTSMPKAIWAAAVSIFAATMVLPPSVWSDTVGGLNTFSAGESARASEVNQNFSAVESAVDGNDGLISALGARVAAVEATDPVPGPQGDPGPQGATGPAGADAASFELVGFTAATFTGGEGVLGFTLACQAEFPNSRMCTSVEVMNTVNVPAGLTGEAWVRPVIEFAYTVRAFDASGVSGNFESDLTCAAWSVPSSFSGLSVASDGWFIPMTCSTPQAVACCREVAAP